MIGVLLLAYAFPVVAAVIAGLFALEWMLRRGLPLIVRSVLRSRQKFEYLSPLEQNLRRASQGFALMVLSAAAVLVMPRTWLTGGHYVTALWPWVLDHPRDAWPLFVCAGLFAIGTIRFLAGAKKAAGARDDIKKPKAAVKLAVGVGIISYLMIVYPRIGAFPGGFYPAMLAWSLGIWMALVGGMRFALLTITLTPAATRLEGHIGGQAIGWRAAGGRRPWWRFGR
jgi:hypothetical protein